MSGEIETILSALNDRNVKYLIVGGVAVVLTALKVAAGRPQDLADLEALERLRGIQG